MVILQLGDGNGFQNDHHRESDNDENAHNDVLTYRKYKVKRLLNKRLILKGTTTMTLCCSAVLPNRLLISAKVDEEVPDEEDNDKDNVDSLVRK